MFFSNALKKVACLNIVRCKVRNIEADELGTKTGLLAVS